MVLLAQKLQNPRESSPPAPMLAYNLAALAIRYEYYKAHTQKFDENGRITAGIELKKSLELVQ